MYAATNGFINTLRWGAFLVAARITLFKNGSSLAVTLPVSYGRFQADRNSAIRRQGELTVEIQPQIPPQTVNIGGTSQPFMPINPNSPLAPFGNEVFVEISVIKDPSVSHGLNGWVPLGYYAIAGSTIDDSGNDIAVTLDLYDRSWPFSRWGLLSNYSVPASTGGLQAEIVALLTYSWNNNGPGRAIAGSVPVPSYISNPRFDLTNYTVPAGVYQQGQDPWAACLDMAASAGFELFFDVNGTLNGRATPGSAAGGTLNSLPVAWGFNPGEVSATGTFAHPLSGTPFTTPVAASLQMQRDKVYNDYWVSAVGPINATGGNTPQQAQARDNNSQSPTYYGGAIGDVPYFVYDSSISSAAQASAEAQYLLGVSLATAWTVSVISPLNPLFEVDDVCTLINPRWNFLDPGQKFIIDTIQTSIRYDVHTVLTGRIIQPGS